MSAQATRGGEGCVTAETEAYSSMSANLPSQSLVFLDQVDADVTATARFELPSDYGWVFENGPSVSYA